VRYLEEIGAMGGIRTFAGFSSGSTVALCSYLGMSSVEQAQLYDELCLKHVIGLNTVDSIIFSKGMDDGSSIINMVHGILDARGLPHGITFEGLSQLYSTDPNLRKKLVLFVSNVTSSTLDALSADTDPDMEVAQAIRMTCSIPIMFTPVFYKGSMYVDGCFFDSRITGSHLGDEMFVTLIIRIHFEFMSRSIKAQESDDIFCYMMTLSSSLMKFIFSINTNIPDTDTDLYVNLFVKTDAVKMTNFLTSSPDKTPIYQQIGYEGVRDKLQSGT